MSDFNDFLKQMASIEMFKGLDEDKIFTLVSQSAIHHYDKGDKIFKEGDPSDKILMVIEGGLRVESGGSFLASVGESQVVGEMGVLTNQRRAADVLATDKSEVLELPKENIEKFIEENPADGIVIFRNVVNVLSRHLKEKNFIAELNRMMDDIEL